MSSRSLISIIIPVFNGEEFLRETLENVDLIINPQDSELEVIVVNDGSTDETSRIAEHFLQTSRLHCKLVNKENGGESSAINTGISSTNADFILVLSHDDLVSPKILVEVLPLLLADETVMAIYPDWEMIDATGNVIAFSPTEEFSDDVQYGQLGNIPGPGSVIRMREEFRSTGIRNSHFGFFSDTEQWMRIGVLGKIKRIPLTLAKWRKHSSNQSVTTSPTRMAMETMALAYNFGFWKSARFSKFEYSAKSSAHMKVARLSLNYKLPWALGGRRQLLLAAVMFLAAKFNGHSFYGIRLTVAEVLLILLNPFGRILLNYRKKLFAEQRLF